MYAYYKTAILNILITEYLYILLLVVFNLQKDIVYNSYGNITQFDIITFSNGTAATRSTKEKLFLLSKFQFSSVSSHHITFKLCNNNIISIFSTVLSAASGNNERWEGR